MRRPLLLAALACLACAEEDPAVRPLRERRLSRFLAGHDDNDLCWDRDGEDGFMSVVDTHNHFRPFGGPAVPFDLYLDWMKVGKGIMGMKEQYMSCKSVHIHSVFL